MRSAVQSCVPLQESTAHRCAFFVYRHQAFPKGWTLTFLTLKACFQSGRNDNGQKWAQRRKAWWQLKWKPNRDSLNGFLGYHATGQKGLEGAARGEWNILRPATWKSSTYESFVSAFLFLGTQTILFFIIKAMSIRELTWQIKQVVLEATNFTGF